MPWLYTKSDVLLLITYVSMTFAPFIMIYGVWKIPDTFKGDATFINGLITASGIMFAFTAAMVASQRDIPYVLKPMLTIDVGTLLYAGLQILDLALNKGTFRITTGFVSASFNANTVTALFAALWRFPKKRH